MRILMRNTVFKTAALAGLFLCMLVFGGAFSGITTSAHAVHADEVDTEEELKQFVKEAVDEYYIDFIIKTQCDFTKITHPGSNTPLSDLIALQTPLSDFLQLPADRIRPTIPLFSTLQLTREIMEQGCDFTQRFAEVFGRGEGDWNSGSIYLFVMDDTGKMLYHGADDTLEGERIVAVDEGGRDVRELIVGEAATPMNDGIVKYCWDNPAVDTDDINDNDDETAPGDSLKVSYVIDPFQDLGAPALSGSPGIIFGSGIYPEMIDPELPECNGTGIAGDGPEPTDPPTEPMPPMEPPMEPGPGTSTSVSGGGCAIAGGGDSTPRNDALNLLLMVSTLFLAVSFGNRAASRRNAIRS